jgi:acetyltransferase
MPAPTFVIAPSFGSGLHSAQSNAREAAMSEPAPPVTSPTYYIFRYPADLIDVWTLAGGTRVTLRPVLPQDEPLLAAFVARLSRGARQQRFQGTALAAGQLAQMTQVDYRHHLAFVVTLSEHGEETVIGDARYVVDDHEHACADFALVIDDGWQRRGIGARALQALAEAAHRRGLRWLRGDVREDNAAMIALAQRCGFLRAPHPEDDALVRVEKPLVSPQRAGPTEPDPEPEPAPGPRPGWLARFMLQASTVSNVPLS